jgi:hypothetical protein
MKVYIHHIHHKLLESQKFQNKDVFENYLSTPPPGFEIKNCEKEINKTQEQIEKLEEVRNHFYDQLTECHMK